MDRGINDSPPAMGLLSRIALAFFLLSIPAAHAVDPAKTTAPEPTTEQNESPRLGPFALRGKIELSTAYDSNIFSLRREPLDDTLLIVAPSLSGTTNWEQHQLGWSLGAVAGRHNEFTGEDYEDYWVDGKGRHDLDDQGRSPETVRTFVAAGATRIGNGPGGRTVPRDIAGMIDHTLLRANATKDERAP